MQSDLPAISWSQICPLFHTVRYVCYFMQWDLFAISCSQICLLFDAVRSVCYLMKLNQSVFDAVKPVCYFMQSDLSAIWCSQICSLFFARCSQIHKFSIRYTSVIIDTYLTSIFTITFLLDILTVAHLLYAWPSIFYPYQLSGQHPIHNNAHLLTTFRTPSNCDNIYL